MSYLARYKINDSYEKPLALLIDENKNAHHLQTPLKTVIFPVPYGFKKADKNACDVIYMLVRIIVTDIASKLTSQIARRELPRCGTGTRYLTLSVMPGPTLRI
jgi:hypothetical protein